MIENTETRLARLEANFARLQQGQLLASLAGVARNPSARSIADVTAAEQRELDSELTTYFAAVYPEVGSHENPGVEAQKAVLAFFPADLAVASAGMWFKDAAQVRGNDYLAFGGPTNHDTGSFVLVALQTGKPLSDFYGENAPVPFDPNFRPKDLGEGQAWDPILNKSVPIEGFFNEVGSLLSR